MPPDWRLFYVRRSTGKRLFFEVPLNNTMDTLSKWAIKDSALKEWLLPHLERLARDPRKSVAGRAMKIKTALM